MYSRRRCLRLPNGVGIIYTGKVASAAIRAAVEDAYGEVPRVFPEQLETTVAFVRHPLDRLVSAWANYSGCDRKPTALCRAGLKQGMSFPAFVMVAARAIDDDNHVATQSSLLAPGGKLLPVFVGRFEDLDADWERVRALCPGLGPLSRLNDSDRGDWREYYDAATLDRAVKLYHGDMELFGYEC